MEKIGTFAWFNIFAEVEKKLKEKENDGYTLIVHPSLFSYDYRIAWTWKEMKKRNEKNILTDKLRIATWRPARAYGEKPTWKSHFRFI